MITWAQKRNITFINVKDFDFSNQKNYNNSVKLFSIKDDLVGPLKELLSQYSIQFFDYGHHHNEKYYYDDTGYAYGIRNGMINISYAFPFRLEHELAHISLINNLNKLLIDNWGMPVINNKKPNLCKKWLLNMEVKVWAIEGFIKNKNREPNRIFIQRSIHENFHIDFHENEYNDLFKLVEQIMFEYESEMTNNKFLDLLKRRFDFIQDKINNGFINSKKFNLFEDD